MISWYAICFFGCCCRVSTLAWGRISSMVALSPALAISPLWADQPVIDDNCRNKVCGLWRTLCLPSSFGAQPCLASLLTGGSCQLIKTWLSYYIAGLLIDCFKSSIEYFRFRFWSQNHFLFFFESKIYCISDCLWKGRNSAKSDCLVLTKNVTSFRNLEQMSRVPNNDQYLLKGQR